MDDGAGHRDLRARVEAALEAVRPGLQMDGGDLELVDIRGDEVLVRLCGACHGCAMATMTLTLFVEERVRRHAPEIRRVVAID